MATRLELILEHTRAGLGGLRARRREVERAAQAAPAPPDFAAALRRPTVALIAEVKRRSPSAGEIRGDLDPAERAAQYEAGGAAAVSVLTDSQFFGGSLDDLRAVRRRVALPLIRKDFILDELQILEARAAGASAVLLIVRALEPARLSELGRFASQAGLAALVEVHDRRELDIALADGASLVGVNRRNLDTFELDLELAWTLLAAIPPLAIAVAESGMSSVADVTQAAAAGADAVLIGSALSAVDSARTAVAGLVGVPRRGR